MTPDIIAEWAGSIALVFLCVAVCVLAVCAIVAMLKATFGVG